MASSEAGKALAKPWRRRCAFTAELLEQVELGSYPEGSESDADDALAAALLAYDNGRGAWPIMSVAERIDCMHGFTKQMVARKRDVVRLIMWEIGKSFTNLKGSSIEPSHIFRPRSGRSRNSTTATRVLR